MNNNYLIHYGVKGMKWGVRHDPIRTGRKRGKNNGKLSTAKKVALGAAVIGAAVYGAHTVGTFNMLKVSMSVSKAYQRSQKASELASTPLKNLSSEKIKIGKEATFGRIDFGKDTNILDRDRMFANRTKKDTNRYKVLLKQRVAGATYESKFKPKSDLIGDSERGRVTTFMGLMTDKKFREALVEDLGHDPKYADKLIDKQNTRKYYVAMQGLLGNKDSKAAKMYIDRTIAKGFDIISDDNDNGAFAEKATIVLNPKNKVSLIGRQRVGAIEKLITKVTLQ